MKHLKHSKYRFWHSRKILKIDLIIVKEYLDSKGCIECMTCFSPEFGALNRSNSDNGMIGYVEPLNSLD